MSKLSTLWKRMHLGKKYLDLGIGCFSRETWRFQSYKSITPNVVIVGSQKCATSSLAHYLSSHPDIHVSSPFKEPGFFIFEEWAKQYWADQRRHFSCAEALLRQGMLDGYCGQRYFIDATTRYTLGNSQRDLNIADRLSNAGVEKIIYLARNPLARVVSAFNHMFVRSEAPPEFNEYLTNDLHLVKTSCFHEQIAPYHQLFGGNNVRVLIFEDWIDDPKSTLFELYDFLELPPPAKLPDFPKINVTRNKVSHRFDASRFEEVLSIIQPDVDRFQQLLGRQLKWDMSPETWVGH